MCAPVSPCLMLHGPSRGSLFRKCGFVVMGLFDRSTFYLFALGSPSSHHPLLAKIHCFSQILLLEGGREK